MIVRAREHGSPSTVIDEGGERKVGESIVEITKDKSDDRCDGSKEKIIKEKYVT